MTGGAAAGGAAGDGPFPVAGVLLTGGSSTRMGTDKARVRVGGVSLAERIAGILVPVCAGPVVEVGSGRSGLPSLVEGRPGRGPLPAVAAGATELGRRGWSGPALVLSCDLPCLTGPALALLAGWPGEGAVVPVRDGRPQPLCARWAAADLAAARSAASGGQRSLKGFPAAHGAARLVEADWVGVAPAECFDDADTPEELARLIGKTSGDPAGHWPGAAGARC